jgi:alanine racemase
MLRQSGIEKPILLLSGVTSRQELDEALRLHCQCVIHDRRQLDLLESCGPSRIVVWLKVDTGMHRLGIDVADAPEFIERLRGCRAVAEVRLMTHLANADQAGDSKTLDQIQRFLQVVAGFDGAISIANSAAMLGWSEVLAKTIGERPNLWVRPGVSLYGISPFPGQCGADLGLQAVMEFESRLIAVKPVLKGGPVGYGGIWKAGRDTTIGIVSAGYGDGYPRTLPSGTPVLVSGRRVQLAGIVSMDLLAVDLGPDAADQVGDPVILWGSDLPAEEVAASAGSIAYQLICGISYREPGLIVPPVSGQSTN